MAILILWLAFSFMVASAGKNRRIGFGASLACSLFFSPLIGAIAVWLSKSLADDAREKQAQQAQIDMAQALNKPSVADELQKLRYLLTDGAITQEEYDAQKQRLLTP